MIKLFLRLTLGTGFLSAVADRFGYWNPESSAWGNWDSFLEYTKTINPWFPDSLIPTIGSLATGVEIIFAICLIVGFKTKLFAKLSGLLLLLFAVSMWFSVGIKGPIDYSVFTASAAAFALSGLKGNYLEIDNIID